MLRRLKGRLTYANVTATLALFLALGGTSYAALKLPRNSVGSIQIRTGAVRSSELRDRSIKLADISRSARNTLRGNIGPQGPSGQQGPAGAPAVRYWEVVSAAGGLIRGTAVGGGHGVNPGQYDVSFGASIGGCAFTATPGTTDTSTVGPARITVNDLGGKVGVQTYDAAGNPADVPFHLLVVC